MGAEVKKLEVTRDAPDGTKPIRIKYWYLPYTIGTGIGHSIVEDGTYADGVETSGRVHSLVLYPGGFVVAELRCGWVPGKPESEQTYTTKYVVLTGGHGVVK